MPLDISEYDALAVDVNGHVIAAGVEPPVVEQAPVTIGVSSTQSAAFNERTRFVRLHCDVACRVAFGVNPTASATSKRMAAGQTEFFGVRPGQRVAVIQAT